MALLLGAAAVLTAASFVLLQRDRGSSEAGTFQLMKLDVDTSTAGVQNTLIVAVGGTFHVRVALEALGQPSYTGYRVKLTYDDAILDAGTQGLAGAMPNSWTAAPDADTGGNVLVFANSANCLPATGTDALQDNGAATDHSEDDLGTNAILMSCVDSLGAAVPGALPQEWVDFYFRCAAPGDVLLRFETNDTHPLPYVLVNTSGWHNAFIYCVGSATPTDTPTPADTPTPTDTATPTDTPAPTITSTSTAVPPTATSTVGGCSGDLDGDAKVTGRDVAIVAVNLLLGGGSGDVDGDGDVDLVDLKLVIAAMQSGVC